MRKTTVYLSDALKASLEHMSAATGRSETELTREVVSSMVGAGGPLRPRLPLFESGDPIAGCCGAPAGSRSPCSPEAGSIRQTPVWC